MTVSAVAEPGTGVALAAIPLNSHEIIVIESRRRLGYDSSSTITAPIGATTTLNPLASEGVLVYTVNTLRGSGQLPIKLVSDNGHGQLDRYPVLDVGESVTLHGYIITVTADGGDTHTVKIARDD